MRPVTFQSVLWGVARQLGMDPARDLNTARAATLTEYINVALAKAWYYDWWPEWTVVELRQFRPSYLAGEFLEAGTERYHVGSDKYYQALQLQVAANQPPATFSAGVWTPNPAWWAESQAHYDAPVQVAGETLAVGDQRRDGETGRSYQVHTAHTTLSGTVDPTKAGGLTAFARTLDLSQAGETPIGQVKAVHARDPRVYPTRSGRFNQRLTAAGLIVLPAQAQRQYIPQTAIPNRVWVEFRLRAPVFTSAPWVSGTAYDLNALVFYRLNGEGDTFQSAIGNNAAPVDGVTNWNLVAFPEILAPTVKLAATAAALTDQKQNSRSTALQDQAQMELERTRDQEINSQQEAESAEVCTYGT